MKTWMPLPLLWRRENRRLADVVELIRVFVELLQCLGIWCGVSGGGGGFLAAGFGIILGGGA